MAGIPDVSQKRAFRTEVPMQEDHLGRIDLEQPRKGRKPFVLRLDSVGSDVWRLLDGRTVRDVLVEVQKAHPGVEDAPARLSKLLSELYKRDLVRFE